MRKYIINRRVKNDIRKTLGLDSTVTLNPVFIDRNGEEFLVVRVLAKDPFGKELYDLAIRQERKIMRGKASSHDHVADSECLMMPTRPQNDESLIPRECIDSGYSSISHLNKAEYSSTMISVIKSRCGNDVTVPEINILSTNKPPTFVTNWIHGTPFADVKRVKAESLTDLIRQVAMLNKNNLVHLDLHDENVLEDYAGKAVIIDWSPIVAVTGEVNEPETSTPLNLYNLQRIISRCTNAFSQKKVE